MARAASARRILVIANEPIEDDALDDAMIAQADAVEVLVVAPALNTRIRHWTSDEDRARREAAARLLACVATLDDADVPVHGWVGDADPICAIADALVFFEADELLIATPPRERSNWLAHDLVKRAGERFALPVTQLVANQADSRSELLVAA